MSIDFADATTWICFITLAVAMWALWVRRHTWSHYWEFGATAAVLLYTVGLPVASEEMAVTVGRWLRHMTGIGGLTNFAGHLFALASTACFIAHMQIRATPDEKELNVVLRRKLYLPGCLVISVMLMLLSQSQEAHHHARINSIAVNGDWWMLAYWMVMCAFGFYLETILALLLLDMRLDQRSRSLAHWYLVGVLFGMCSLAICTVTKLYNDTDNSRYMWVFGALSAMMFCGGAGWSWVSKVRRWRRSIEQGVQEIREHDASLDDPHEGTHGEQPPTNAP